MSIATPTLVGGGFAYEQDDDWAKTPAGYEFPEAAGVDVDADDNVYVFNRGPHPVIVYDKHGNFLRSFGEDVYTEREHGIHISPDGYLLPGGRLAALHPQVRPAGQADLDAR